MFGRDNRNILMETLADIGLKGFRPGDGIQFTLPTTAPAPTKTPAQTALAERLPRVEEVPASILPLSKELAEKAWDVLGYGLGATRVAETELTAEGTKKLFALGIKPFNKKAVQEYKDTERAKHRRPYVDAHWVMTPISAYPNAVPEFVLDTAVRVKQAIPEAEILVDNMEQVYRDPFLVVRYHGIDFWVEVWDEPKFKEERVV